MRKLIEDKIQDIVKDGGDELLDHLFESGLRTDFSQMSDEELLEVYEFLVGFAG